MFLKTRKKLGILLLVCLLILETIPFAFAGASMIDAINAENSDPAEEQPVDDNGWVFTAYHYLDIIDADFNDLKEAAYSENWQTEYPKCTSRIIADSQEAINWSEPYKTNPSYYRAKEEFKIAMEQVAEMAVAFNKSEEANINGNQEDELAYAKKITEYGNSYRLHEGNVYDLTRVETVDSINKDVAFKNEMDRLTDDHNTRTLALDWFSR